MMNIRKKDQELPSEKTKNSQNGTEGTIQGRRQWLAQNIKGIKEKTLQSNKGSQCPLVICIGATWRRK